MAFYDDGEDYEEEFEGDDMEGEEEEFGDDGDGEDFGGGGQAAALQQMLRGQGGGGAGGKEAVKAALKHDLIQYKMSDLMKFKKSELLVAGTAFLLTFKESKWQPVILGGLLFRWLRRQGAQREEAKKWRQIQNNIISQLQQGIELDLDTDRSIANAETALRAQTWRPNIQRWMTDYERLVAMYYSLIIQLKAAESKGAPLSLTPELISELQWFKLHYPALLSAVQQVGSTADAAQQLAVMLKIHSFQEPLVPDDVKPDKLDQFVSKLSSNAQRAVKKLTAGKNSWMEDSSYLSKTTVSSDEAWQDYQLYKEKKKASAPAAGMGGMGGFPGMGGFGGLPGGLQSLLAGLGGGGR